MLVASLRNVTTHGDDEFLINEKMAICLDNGCVSFRVVDSKHYGFL